MVMPRTPFVKENQETFSTSPYSSFTEYIEMSEIPSYIGTLKYNPPLWTSG